MIWKWGSRTTGGPGPVAPDRPVWAIGDVHGCTDQLEALLAEIAVRGPGEQIVFLGDYSDRGPDSAGALRRIRALQVAGGGNVVCLMGNHDRMLLDFLADPVRAGARFLANGGQDTLMSFGVLPARTGTAEERLTAQAEAFAAAIGDLPEWIAALPLWHRSGNCVFVHAQTDPRAEMEAQSEAVLLWARPPKRQVARRDGAWVIHGHTIMRQPTVEAGHIAIDTGAYRGRALTAVRLAAGSEPEFVQA